MFNRIMYCRKEMRTSRICNSTKIRQNEKKVLRQSLLGIKMFELYICNTWLTLVWNLKYCDSSLIPND